MEPKEDFTPIAIMIKTTPGWNCIAPSFFRFSLKVKRKIERQNSKILLFYSGPGGLQNNARSSHLADGFRKTLRLHFLFFGHGIRNSWPKDLTQRVAPIFVPSRMGHAPCKVFGSFLALTSMFCQTRTSPAFGWIFSPSIGNTVAEMAFISYRKLHSLPPFFEVCSMVNTVVIRFPSIGTVEGTLSSR